RRHTRFSRDWSSDVCSSDLNISGNIANSQTIGYKRIDTSFVDMIPDAPVKQQIAGAVSSYSRSMNTLRGDIQNADTETYMALNRSEERRVGKEGRSRASVHH